MSGYYSTWIPAKKNDHRKSWRRELIGYSREGIAEEAEEIRNMLCSDGGIFLGQFFPESVASRKNRRNSSQPPTPTDDE